MYELSWIHVRFFSNPSIFLHNITLNTKRKQCLIQSELSHGFLLACNNIPVFSCSFPILHPFPFPQQPWVTCRSEWQCGVDGQWSELCSPGIPFWWCSGWVHPFPCQLLPWLRPEWGFLSSEEEHEQDTPAAFVPH